jgi:hypothetical protein
MLSPVNGLGAKGVFAVREDGGVQVDLTGICCEPAKANAENRNTMTADVTFRQAPPFFLGLSPQYVSKAISEPHNSLLRRDSK